MSGEMPEMPDAEELKERAEAAAKEKAEAAAAEAKKKAEEKVAKAQEDAQKAAMAKVPGANAVAALAKA